MTLITRKQTLDAHHYPITEEVEEVVDDVLIGEPTQAELESTGDVKHERATYMLAIPKGDTHDWQDATVVFWGRRWRQIGRITQGIEANVPLDWNKKVMVEEVI